MAETLENYSFFDKGIFHILQDALQESDSEGQLVVYDPEEYAYRIFSDDLPGYS